MENIRKTISENQLTGDPCPDCGGEVTLVAAGNDLLAECECAEALVLV